MSHFDRAYEYTLKNEGGFSNHPNDKGGATMMGVTLATYSRWLGRPATAKELKEIKPETVKEIYKAWYWDIIRLDKVQKYPIACAVYDIGVVCGPRTSMIMAQRVMREMGDIYMMVDGLVGPVTLRGLNGADEKEFINRFKVHVDKRFTEIAERSPSQRVFLRGWLNRSNRLLTLLEDK